MTGGPISPPADAGPGPHPPTPTGVRSACYAPHSALYLEPSGLVQACCATAYDLGWVSGPDRQTLRQIWDGATTAAQRSALEHGSFDYGCQECEIAIAAGGRTAATATHFDRFAAGAPHPYPRMLDLALSNRCNLECVMCAGHLSSTIRAKREHLPPLPSAYDDAFFEELWTFLPHVERLQFKGGEPFLAPENRRIWDRLLATGHRPEITVTTNGTIFDPRVERYVRELRMEPIISIDGIRPETQETIRIGSEAAQVWANVDRFQAIAEEHDLGTTLSMCFMVENWREALPFLQEADRRGANGNLIFVNQPHRHDVLRLPHDELVQVLGALEAAPATFTGPRRQHHEDLWARTLQRLRAQVEQPVELVVRSPPPPRRLVPDGAIAARRTALRAAGSDPLEVGVRDEVVVEVVVPPWAGWLEPAGWVDGPIEGVGRTLGERLGPFQPGVPTIDADGVEVTEIDVRARDRVRRLTAHRVAEASGDHRILIVGDLEPPEGRPDGGSGDGSRRSALP